MHGKNIKLTDPRWASTMLMVPVVVSSIAVTFPQKAIAQALEEVRVTALRRDQDTLDVPSSVKAFGEQTIIDANITRADDFVNLTPNAVVINSNQEGESFLVVRGMAPARNAESSTAVVIDGVLQTGPNSLAQDLFDVEQIELLKGPQTALYGRNAVGGAVVITTRRPTDEVEGFVKLGMGQEERSVLQGGISGPIVEGELYGQFVISHNEFDGAFENINTGERVDRRENRSARARLIWEPTETLSADLRFAVTDFEGGGIAFTSLTEIGGAPASNVHNIFPDFVANIRSGNDQEKENVSLKIDWETEYGTLTSVSAYDFIEDVYFADQFPYSFDNIQTQWVLFDNEGLSQDIRWTSPGDDRFRYIVGAYFADIETDRITNLATDIDGRLLEGRRPTSFPNPTESFRFDTTEKEVWSVYAHLAFDITDDLEIALAARYDEEEWTNTDLAPPEFSATSGLERVETFDQFSPKVTLNWRVADNYSLYTSYGEGFKSGGFNPPGTGELVAAFNPFSTVQDEYGEETSESFELGFKGEFLDGTLSLEGAYFYTEAENFQTFEFFPGPSLQAISQVDQAEIEGWEFEFQYQPQQVSGLNLYGGVGFTEAEVAELSADPSRVGNKLPYTPEYTLNLGGQYTWPIMGGGLEMLVRVDYSEIGDTYWETNNFAGADRPPIELLNLRAAVRAPGGEWEVAAWVTNALDEEYYAENVFLFGPGQIPGITAISANFQAPPSLWGVDFRYNF